MILDAGMLFQIISLLLTVGGIVVYVTRRDATTKEQINNLNSRMDTKDKRDDDQDVAIARVDAKATSTDKNVAVINERTKNMDKKLDELLSRD